MDWSFITRVIPLYWRSALFAAEIGSAGVVLSVVLGLACEFVEYFRVPILRKVVRAYVSISRNTPLLIQLFFVYYGFPRIGLRMNAVACGIVGLSFLGGGYMAETFRSGMEAIGVTQSESALSLGLSEMQVARFIILPQALSVSVPGIIANVIFLLKETSVFSAISLMDLMFTAKDLIGLYYNTVECLALLVVFYLLILLPVSLVGRVLEKRLRHV